MKHKAWVRNAPCPECKRVGEVREILYGMPDPSFDWSDFEIGGCCISSDMPEVACRACDWWGKLDDLIETTP